MYVFFVDGLKYHILRSRFVFLWLSFAFVLICVEHHRIERHQSTGEEVGEYFGLISAKLSFFILGWETKRPLHLQK